MIVSPLPMPCTLHRTPRREYRSDDGETREEYAKRLRAMRDAREAAHAAEIESLFIGARLLQARQRERAAAAVGHLLPELEERRERRARSAAAARRARQSVARYEYERDFGPLPWQGVGYVFQNGDPADNGDGTADSFMSTTELLVAGKWDRRLGAEVVPVMLAHGRAQIGIARVWRDARGARAHLRLRYPPPAGAALSGGFDGYRLRPGGFKVCGVEMRQVASAVLTEVSIVMRAAHRGTQISELARVDVEAAIRRLRETGRIPA